MTPAFRIDLSGSVRLAAVLAALHVAAALAAAVTMAGLPVAMILAGIALSGIVSARWLLSPHRFGIHGLGWDEAGDICWLNASGEWGAVAELRPLYVSVWLIIIWLRPAEVQSAGRGHWLVLGSDSAHLEKLRHLRVLLRNARRHP